MQFDAVTKFHELKREYMRVRGATRATGTAKARSGQSLMVAGQLVPKTTWGDVTAFSIRYLAATSNESIRSCIRKADGNVAGFESLVASTTIGSQLLCGSTFVETSLFKRSRDEWSHWTPAERIIAEFGYTYGGQLVLRNRIISKEIYPYNEAFWGAGSRYAIARSAAGIVKTSREIMEESIEEAMKELPDTLKRAALAVVPDIPLSLPGLGSLATIMKWGTIAGGAYFVYWLIKNKK